MGNPAPSAQQIRFATKDRPLRRDVGRLGALLGELLRELAPEGVYETVEAARLAARRRRRGEAAAGAELAELLGALSPGRALDLVRAFSAYFGVVNTAEQVHRMRRSIDYLRAGTEQPGSLRAAARRPPRSPRPWSRSWSSPSSRPIRPRPCGAPC